MEKLFFTIATILFSLIVFSSNSSATSMDDFLEERDLPLTTYAVGWWGGAAPGTSLTDDNIQKYYLRQGMRFHYQLDIGWNNAPNTSASNIVYRDNIDSFLDITD